jgi:hypothetical protein
MTHTVQRANAAVGRKYSAEEWSSIASKDRIAEIYEEVRRLDAEAASQKDGAAVGRRNGRSLI